MAFPRPQRLLLPPRPVAWVATLLLLPCLVGPDGVGADEDPPRARWDAARRTSITRLHELASWCNAKRLFAGRATAYELVLLFDADDATARKRLRYRRDAAGRWTRTPRHEPPRNLGPGRKRFEERLAAWRTSLLDEIRPLLDEVLDAGDVALRCEILRATIAAAPDDADLRRANDEVRHTWNDTTAWVLRESQVAKERRFDLQRFGAAVVQEVPEPRIDEPRSEERIAGVAWGQVLTGRRVRVLGTAAPPEMDLQLAHCEAIGPVLRATLSLDDESTGSATGPERLTVYVTRSAEVGNRFLRALPGLEPAVLDRLLAASSARRPGRRAVLVRGGSRPWRLEAGPKELAALGVADAVGVDDADAWLAEGLAHYLTRLVTGTRQVFRTGHGMETGTAAWLGSPTASVNLAATEDWLGAGHDLCTSASRPGLLAMAGKDLRAITPDEVLLGYCLVAYLVEGRPDACTDFFRAVGRAPADELESAVLTHLRCDLGALEERLVRWLAETTGRVDRD